MKLWPHKGRCQGTYIHLRISSSILFYFSSSIFTVPVRILQGTERWINPTFGWRPIFSQNKFSFFEIQVFRFNDPIQLTSPIFFSAAPRINPQNEAGRKGLERLEKLMKVCLPFNYCTFFPCFKASRSPLFPPHIFHIFHFLCRLSFNNYIIILKLTTLAGTGSWCTWRGRRQRGWRCRRRSRRGWTSVVDITWDFCHYTGPLLHSFITLEA